MKKKRHSEPEQTQYRMRYLLGEDVFPVEKFFMAATAEQALEMFAYSCRDFETTPALLDFAKWNRWANEWDFEVPKEVAQQQIQSVLDEQNTAKAETTNSNGTKTTTNNGKLLKELEMYKIRYNNPYYFIRGKPNPKYKREIDRINQIVNKHNSSG
jgi:acid phosphatase class B